LDQKLGDERPQPKVFAASGLTVKALVRLHSCPASVRDVFVEKPSDING